MVPRGAPLATTAEVVAAARRPPTWPSCSTRPPATPFAALPVPATGPIVVVVGPEGGIADDELAAFEAAGVRAVRLGAEVLRTSTAGVAAVAALLARTPRWS